jgi:hypothetical protein
MTDKITFDTLLNEVKSEYMNDGKNTKCNGLDLFNLLKDTFEYIYLKKKWGYKEQQDSYPSRKDALYNFFKEKLSSHF